MKRTRKREEWLLLALVIGFFCGILYQNLMGRNLQTTKIFSEHFLKQYTEYEINQGEYMLCVAQARIIPMILLGIAGRLQWKKAIVIGYLFWTGFLGGIVLVSSIVELGMGGILVCIATVFPHFIFYGLAYCVVIMWIYRASARKWNNAKTIFVSIMLLSGILLETYLSPMIMKKIVFMLM